MDKIILFNKPILWTSHDAVDFFRRRLGQRKVGHAGSLDPMATGLLLILAGSATKLSSSLSGLDKDYRGVMTLGVTTDTLDLEGKILSESDASSLQEMEVRRVMAGFEGQIRQVPPAFSAVKRQGKKLYEWARRGVPLDVEAREITVKRFELTALSLPDAHFSLSCSKGTYVRTLCDEVGKALGCGAALSALVRTRIGEYHLKDAVTQDRM